MCYFLETKFYLLVVIRVGLVLHASLNAKITEENSLKFLIAVKLVFSWYLLS